MLWQFRIVTVVPGFGYLIARRQSKNCRELSSYVISTRSRFLLHVSYTDVDHNDIFDIIDTYRKKNWNNQQDRHKLY